MADVRREPLNVIVGQMPKSGIPHSFDPPMFTNPITVRHPHHIYLIFAKPFKGCLSRTTAAGAAVEGKPTSFQTTKEKKTCVHVTQKHLHEDERALLNLDMGPCD